MNKQEPVATKLDDDYPCAFHVSIEDREKLQALPAGTQLFASPIPQADLVAEIDRLKAENDRLVREVVNRNARALEGDKFVAIRDRFIRADEDLRQQLSESKSMLEASLDVADAHVVTIKEIEQQLAAAQQDNEQLVKALEDLPYENIAEQPEWHMSDSNPTIWRLFLERYCSEAIAAHKARQQ